MHRVSTKIVLGTGYIPIILHCHAYSLGRKKILQQTTKWAVHAQTANLTGYISYTKPRNYFLNVCVDNSKQVSGFVFMPSDLHKHTHFFNNTCMQQNKYWIDEATEHEIQILNILQPCSKSKTNGKEKPN